MLPLWPGPQLTVQLDFDSGYEDSCRVFRIS